MIYPFSIYAIILQRFIINLTSAVRSSNDMTTTNNIDQLSAPVFCRSTVESRVIGNIGESLELAGDSDDWSEAYDLEEHQKSENNNVDGLIEVVNVSQATSFVDDQPGVIAPPEVTRSCP